MVQVGPRAATSAAIDVNEAPPAVAEAAIAPAEVEVEAPQPSHRRRPWFQQDRAARPVVCGRNCRWKIFLESAR